MKIARASLILVPLVLFSVKSANAQCAHEFFPWTVGETLVYKNPAGAKNQIQVTGYNSSTGVVTMKGTPVPSTPSSPTAALSASCKRSGVTINFDVASSPAAPGFTTNLTTGGAQFPGPADFVVRPSPHQQTWTRTFTVTNSMPGGMTMTLTVKETHTIEGLDNNIGQTSAGGPWNGAFRIRVDSSTTTAITGVPSGMHVPPIPPTSATIYQWVVKGVGLVQYGPLSGPWTELISVTTPP